jgi:hypothetical protein
VTSVLFLVLINIILGGVQIWLVADMAGYPIDFLLSVALSVIFVVFFSGSIGSSWEFRKLAERRLSFNVLGLACITLTYMLSG